MDQRVLWRPNPGPQTRFLASTASEVLYGGAAGGGKSAASVALPLKWIHNGAFRALFLRREAKYLSDAIDKSQALYPHFGGHLVLRWVRRLFLVFHDFPLCRKGVDFFATIQPELPRSFHFFLRYKRIKLCQPRPYILHQGIRHGYQAFYRHRVI